MQEVHVSSINGEAKKQANLRSKIQQNESFKVVHNPVFLRSTNLDPMLRHLNLVVSFGNRQPFTVHILGDFPSFLLALAFNNAFIITLVKIWLRGAPHVVRTLKLSLDRHILKI